MLLIFSIFLLFIAAAGSAAAADTGETVTNSTGQDISFDYTEKSCENILAAEDEELLGDYNQYETYDGVNYYYDDSISSSITEIPDSPKVGDTVLIKLGSEHTEHEGISENGGVFVRLDGDNNNWERIGTYEEAYTTGIYYTLKNGGSHYIQPVFSTMGTLSSGSLNWFAKGAYISGIEGDVNRTYAASYTLTVNPSTVDYEDYFTATFSYTDGDFSISSEAVWFYVNGVKVLETTVSPSGFLSTSGSVSVQLQATTSGTLTVEAFVPQNDKDNDYLKRGWAGPGYVTVNGGSTECEFSVSPNNTEIYIGQSITVQSSVTPDDAEGTVVYTFDDGTASKTLSTGESFDYTPLTEGSRVITAVYSSDSYPSQTKQLYVTVLALVEVNPTITVTNVTYPGKATARITVDAPGTYTVYINSKLYTLTFVEGETSKTIEADLLDVKNGYEANVSFEGSYKYESGFASTTFNVLIGEINVHIDVDNVHYPNKAVAVLSTDVSGTYTVSVGNLFTKDVFVTAGTPLSVQLDQLEVGEYTASVTGSIDNYASASHSATFNILSEDIVLTSVSVRASAKSVKVGNDVNINVVLSKDVEGSVYVVINGKRYEENVTDSKATIVIPDLAYGSYSVEVKYSGDTYHKSAYTLTSFNVKKNSAAINASADSIRVGNNVIVNVAVSEDAEGTVSVNINNVDYNATVLNGEATVVLPNLDAGQYSVTVDYGGDASYNSVSTVTSFNVKKQAVSMKASASTVRAGEDVVVEVELSDDASGNISLAANGKVYNAAVVNGKANITISDLPVADYSVEVTYSGDANYCDYSVLASFKVKKTVVSMKAQTKSVKAGSNAAVSVVMSSDATGTVSVQVNEQQYTATVSSGVASISIPGLSAGKYVLDVLYGGDDKYNPYTAVTSFNVKA